MSIFILIDTFPLIFIWLLFFSWVIEIHEWISVCFIIFRALNADPLWHRCSSRRPLSLNAGWYLCCIWLHYTASTISSPLVIGMSQTTPLRTQTEPHTASQPWGTQTTHFEYIYIYMCLCKQQTGRQTVVLFKAQRRLCADLICAMIWPCVLDRDCKYSKASGMTPAIHLAWHDKGAQTMKD